MRDWLIRQAVAVLDRVRCDFSAVTLQIFAFTQVIPQFFGKALGLLCLLPLFGAFAICFLLGHYLCRKIH